MTTTELSTSMPTEMARPDRDIMLMDTLAKYIMVSVAIRLTGILNRVITVGRQSRRNSSSTSTENTTPQPRLERMESRMR